MGKHLFLSTLLIPVLGLLVAGCGGDNKKEIVYHQVSVSSTGGGYVNIGDGKARDRYWGYMYPIVANEHYQLASIKGCGGRVNGSYYETGSILADCVITAVFAPIQYQATVNNDLGGNITPTSATAPYGGNLTFTVAVKEGFELLGVYGCNGVLVGTSYLVSSRPGDCTIVAQTAIDNAPSTSLIEGTVAEGAALANVAVTARCSDGSGFLAAVTTNAQGRFSGEVGEDALPCALVADNRYYSLASEEGTANITPLTSLVLALASHQSGADWFADANWAAVEPFIDVAEALLGAQLNLSGYAMPAGEFDPFTAQFTLGDAWDQLLDELMLAVAAEGGVDNFQALIQLMVNGDIDQLPASSQ